MLVIVSILLSLLIVAFGVFEGRRWFGAYAHSIERLRLFAEKLGTCSEGLSFMEVARGWLQEEEAVTRRMARNLLRHFGKESISLHGRQGWVVDVDDLCDGKRMFKSHPAAVRVEAMPGLLTGTGILFTFLGLAIGVFGLDPTDAEQLTQGVKKLLGGMSLAFLTSIAGIGTGLWWSWRSREVAAVFESVYGHIAEVLHEKNFILLPEEMNYQFIDDQRDQVHALQSLEGNLYNAFKRALSESGFHEIRELLAQSLAKDDVREALGGPLKEIHRELKAISQSLAAQADNQRLMGKALKRLLQGNAPGATGAPGGVTAPGAGVTGVPGDQTRFMADALKLAENFRGIHDSQESTLAAINASAEQLKKMMKAARLANADIVKLHSVLVNHLEGIETHWANYREQLDTMQQTLAKSIAGFEGELGQSLGRVHGEFDSLLAKGLGHFTGAMRDFQHTIHSFSDAVKGAPPAGDEPPKSRGGLFGKRKS